jgi:uracil-DNA glycosylase family protein
MTAQPFVPPAAELDELRAAATTCQGCELYSHATQVVFSTGPSQAPVVLVGEQPGDIEDRRGEPFVGPAGALLDRALAEVGLDRADAYLTNVVKHFKHHLDRGGKRRIHDTPRRDEIVACRPWLIAEFAQLRPRVVVALGATAAQALCGASFRVTKSRGEVFDWPAVAHRPADFPAVDPPARFVATFHPSAVLRAEDREGAFADLVADLNAVSGLVRRRR